MDIKVAVVGHRPGGLGDKWRPLDWMPAIARIRDRLAARQAETGGELTVIAIPDEGFGMMAACAALMLRGEGAPVQLWLISPHRDHRADVVHVEAGRWWDRMTTQADEWVIVSQDGRSLEVTNREDGDACRLGAWGDALSLADEALICWNGTRRGVTFRCYEGLCRAGGPYVNVYAEVAEALKLRGVLRGRRERAAGYGPVRKREPRLDWFGLRT